MPAFLEFIVHVQKNAWACFSSSSLYLKSNLSKKQYKFRAKLKKIGFVTITSILILPMLSNVLEETPESPTQANHRNNKKHLHPLVSKSMRVSTSGFWFMDETSDWANAECTGFSRQMRILPIEKWEMFAPAPAAYNINIMYNNIRV